YPRLVIIGYDHDAEPLLPDPIQPFGQLGRSQRLARADKRIVQIGNDAPNALLLQAGQIDGTDRTHDSVGHNPFEHEESPARTRAAPDNRVYRRNYTISGKSFAKAKSREERGGRPPLALPGHMRD